MMELLKTLGMPGGILAIVVAWWTTTHTPKSQPKTRTEDTAHLEAKKIVRDSGIEAHWNELFEELRKQIGELRTQLEDARREAVSNREVIQILYGYSYKLRSQIESFGKTPYPWPKRVNPDNQEK